MESFKVGDKVRVESKTYTGLATIVAFPEGSCGCWVFKVDAVDDYWHMYHPIPEHTIAIPWTTVAVLKRT